MFHIGWMGMVALSVVVVSDTATHEIADLNSDSSSALNAAFVGLVTLSALSMGLTQVAGDRNPTAQRRAMLACALFFFAGVPLLYVYACKSYVITPSHPRDGFERWRIIHERDFWIPKLAMISYRLFQLSQALAFLAMLAYCDSLRLVLRAKDQPPHRNGNQGVGDRVKPEPPGIMDKP